MGEPAQINLAIAEFASGGLSEGWKSGVKSGAGTGALLYFGGFMPGRINTGYIFATTTTVNVSVRPLTGAD